MSQSTAEYFLIDQDLIDIWESFLTRVMGFVVNSLDGWGVSALAWLK